jgi:PhnB protein
MAQLSPYLFFKGNCREAMMFYKDALDAKLFMQAAGESPMAAQMPKEMHNNVLHSSLERDGFSLMGADIMDSDMPNHGNTIYLCLVCRSKEEIETLFSKLSAGGKVIHPLKEEFIGVFTDKFGFNWMLQYGTGPQG